MTTTAPLRTDPSASASRLGAAGALTAVAALGAALAVVPAGDGGTTAAGISDRYAADGWVPATLLQVVGVVGVLVLAAALTSVLHAAPRAVRALVLAGAGVAAALQLTGHALIVTLAGGTAERGGGELVLALYDLSSAAFGLASAGSAVLLVAVAAGGRALTRWLRWFAAAAAAAAALAAASLAPDGPFSVHGDVGFLALVLVHLWYLAAGVVLLRRGS